MKKIVIFAVLGLFLCGTAFARVVVLQDGKTTILADNSEFTVAGKDHSRVLYDGVLITVPPHKKVKIGKKDGKIMISGTNLKGVEISGKSISSKGNTIIYVSPDTMKITTVQGDTSIIDNGVVNNHLQKNSKTKNSNKDEINRTDNKNSSVESKTSAPAAENIVFPEASEYVNEVAAQQTAQDVENTDLSQSSPRS